jgi:hypothetical protein
MALSLAIAFTLWYYVISVVSPGSEAWYYNIPVVFEGETVLNQDRGLMITSNIDDIDIDLKLSGNRTDLAKVNSGNITIKVDLSKVYDPGIHELSYSIAYPGDVPQGALTTESKSPETIKLTVEMTTNIITEMGSSRIPISMLNVSVKGSQRKLYGMNVS